MSRAIAGINTGSVVSFDFGKITKMPFEFQKNKAHFRGEICMMVCCPWRIESDTNIVCGSGDSNEKKGPMIKGLDDLKGKYVQEIMFNTFLDISIVFEGGYVLKVFCDNISDDDYESCYFFLFEEDLLCVSVRGNGNIWSDEIVRDNRK